MIIDQIPSTMIQSLCFPVPSTQSGSVAALCYSCKALGLLGLQHIKIIEHLANIGSIRYDTEAR